ncbi:MAG: XrtA/PEP-CTERM system-associated ATPase [Rhizomicrobium sp.]
MYADYFSLSGMPFQLTPDGRFFFGSSEHSKAMAFLNYGISQGEGFVVVTGEVGAGKTTLVDHLLSELDPTRFVAGRIVTTQLNSYDTLRMACSAFNLFREGMDKATMIRQLQQLFASLHSQHRRALLIVDEAQSLTGEALEELRMLSNLVTSKETPFQVILLGQPEFRAILTSPAAEQVKQRVTASCHLGPLGEEDTRLYIEHRLRQVNWVNDPEITAQAFAEIYRCTGGIPRRINTLCSRLLLLAFLDQKHKVDGDMVIAVAAELSAEFGPTTGIPAAPPPKALLSESSGIPLRTDTRLAGSGDLERRMAALEMQISRHETVIQRALELAAHYFPDVDV